MPKNYVKKPETLSITARNRKNGKMSENPSFLTRQAFSCGERYVDFGLIVLVNCRTAFDIELKHD